MFKTDRCSRHGAPAAADHLDALDRSAIVWRTTYRKLSAVNGATHVAVNVVNDGDSVLGIRADELSTNLRSGSQKGFGRIIGSAITSVIIQDRDGRTLGKDVTPQQ
ncbi:hypothetical protein [Methylorubrum extorquens]